MARAVAENHCRTDGSASATVGTAGHAGHRVARREQARYRFTTDVEHSAVAVGAFIYQAYDTAGSLNDRELGLRAEDLARAIVRDGSGRPRLELPSKLAAAYAAAPADETMVEGAVERTEDIAN